MKNTGRLLAVFMCALLCAAAGGAVSACKKDDTQKAVPADISFEGMKTQFAFGEEFSCDGLIVTVTYSDKSEKVAAKDEYTVDSSNYNKNAAGDYGIMVRLNGTKILRSYTVTVNESAEKWDTDGALKVLCIGNSFSVDMAEYAYHIAKSLGIKEVHLGNMYIPGCSLDTHADNARKDASAYTYYVNKNGSWVEYKSYKMSDAIASQNWDFITLQQASGSSGIQSTYGELEYLVNYVKDKLPENAHTKLVWHMTWAYQGDSSHSEFPKYDNNQTKMYEMIVSAVRNIILPDKNFKIIIPNGTAVQNARSSFVGDNLTRDGYHLSYDLGRYTAGLTMLHALTGLAIDDVAYAPAGVDSVLKSIAIESAKNAVKEAYSVTPSQIDELPMPSEEDYILLDYGVTQGYWESNHATEYNVIRTPSNLVNKYFATKRFTKREIPVGSVIILESGWQYRPEGWVDDARQSGRPNNVSLTRVEVTESWWGDYTLRAFNISKAGTPIISGQSAQAKSALKIYVPKNA